jgi:hypothetical protein
MKTKHSKKLKIPSLNYDKFKFILIAASKFSDSQISDVPNIENNIEALNMVLSSKNFLGIDKKNIYIIKNPNKVEFEKNLKQFVDALSFDDTLFVYYAGHGLIDPESLDIFLASKQSNSNDIPSTSVSLKRFRNIISNSLAKQKIVFIDACFSGNILSTSANASIYENTLDFEGEFIVSSSSENNYSLYPADNKYGTTYFTAELLNVITAGIPSAGKYLTLNDIYAQIYKNLKSKNLPIPQKTSINNIENMPFVVNKAYSYGKELNILKNNNAVQTKIHSFKIYKGNSILNIALSISLIFIFSTLFFANRINKQNIYTPVNYSYKIKNVRQFVRYSTTAKKNINPKNDKIADFFDKIEIFEKADNNTEAIIYYLNKILDIDPTNAKAKTMLKNLKKN